MSATPIENTRYNPSPPPVIDPTDPLYLQRELKKLEVALNSITEILKKLDARLTAGGL
jgi:hypothetical protein